VAYVASIVPRSKPSSILVVMCGLVLTDKYTTLHRFLYGVGNEFNCLTDLIEPRTV
jgi:hypothetical protein